MQIKQTRFETIPMGEYPAVIRDIEPQEGQFGPQLKFTFELIEGEHQGTTLLAWTSQTFSPRSNLFKWTRAAFARDIPPTYDLDTSHLIGKKVRLAVLTKAKDDGSEFNKVDDVKAYQKNPNKVEAAAPFEEPEAAGTPF